MPSVNLFKQQEHWESGDKRMKHATALDANAIQKR
jgi:hypothetical protein